MREVLIGLAAAVIGVGLMAIIAAGLLLWSANKIQALRDQERD